LSSPQYHHTYWGSRNGHIHDIKIYVESKGEINWSRLTENGSPDGEKTDIPFPIYAGALNTDGIDISGENYLVERVNITNFDDCVVPKPSSGGKCTRNITVLDSEVHFGVGMSIGSITAEEDAQCIRDVTFRNV